MKKLMFSLCALCLVGAASAQTRESLSERAQKLSQQSASYKLEMQDVQKNRKADDGVDSIPVQSYFGWEHWYTFNWLSRPGQDLQADGFCNADYIEWVYGTGGFVSMAGSGEIGYRFWAGPRSSYIQAYMTPNLGIPYAAAADVIRAPSTLRQHDGEYDSMPIWFKVYDQTKVGAQEVLGGITQYTPADVDYVDVVYPTNPERFSARTDTVWIPAGCATNSNGKLTPYYDLYKAEFKDVAHWKPLGENFCVSMMFPIDWDEEGDTVMDASWNAMPMIMIQENGDFALSQRPHSVYLVHDFQKTTHMWKNNRPENKERYPDMVLDSLMQPNPRYAVLPFDCWYWQNGENTTGEPVMFIYYTDWTSMESANKADRYVQLSPVPAVDYVNFKSYTNMNRIEIYSLGGKLVKAVNVSGDTYRMDLSGMTSGMYVARIYSEKGISSKKLVVR